MLIWQIVYEYHLSFFRYSQYDLLPNLTLFEYISPWIYAYLIPLPPNHKPPSPATFWDVGDLDVLGCNRRVNEHWNVANSKRRRNIEKIPSSDCFLWKPASSPTYMYTWLDGPVLSIDRLYCLCTIYVPVYFRLLFNQEKKMKARGLKMQQQNHKKKPKSIWYMICPLNPYATCINQKTPSGFHHLTSF